MTKRKVHVIGICGKTTSALAKMFKELGWEVKGSDRSFYPPASTFLKKSKIEIRSPYREENLDPDTDLVIIGGNALVVDPHNPEYEKAKRLKIKTVSYPQVLQEFLIKENSIVICGTYGKTTITALISWILEVGGYDPSFMIGGNPLNFTSGVKLGHSNYSVVEGDEYPTLNFDPRPKFMFYKPKYLLLTSVSWDHVDVFPTQNHYIQAFSKLARLVSPEGQAVVCLDGENVSKVIPKFFCPLSTYSLYQDIADWKVKDVVYKERFTHFTITGKERFKIESLLIGEHNVQNVLGAVALLSEIGIGKDAIYQGVKTFRGVELRLQLIAEAKGIKIYRDLAHSPIEAKRTLQALRARYPKKRLLCVFDVHATSLRHKKTLPWYKGAFDQADLVILPKVEVFTGIPEESRVTGKMVKEAIQSTQPDVLYIPKDEKLRESLEGELTSGDVLVFMSSGGLRGTVERLVQNLSFGN